MNKSFNVDGNTLKCSEIYKNNDNNKYYFIRIIFY